ncbi:MAG: flagellar protein FliJ [Thermoleophilaceae bacterium]|nr:flagellar protein FliJ [Thermoleophilaceae bacterium]
MATRSFNFRLERVRSIRESIEDQAREEFAQSLALRLRGEGMLRAAEAELEAARQARRATGSAIPASGLDLISAQAYVEQAQMRRESRMLDLDRFDAEVDHRREALTRASQDRQALERLKDKQRNEHEVEVQRIDAIALDEMALNMHRRGQEAA